MLKWNNLTDGWISFLCARVEAVPSFLGNDRWEGLCCFTTIGEMLSCTLRRVKQLFICLYSWFSFFLDKMEIKTTHLSLCLFVHQLLTSFYPQMTCMWIWPTHCFNPAAPELNLGSSHVCFPVISIFFSLICHRTSAMCCMYGSSLCGGAVYREFYYISLIKQFLFTFWTIQSALLLWFNNNWMYL